MKKNQDKTRTVSSSKGLLMIFLVFIALSFVLLSTATFAKRSNGNQGLGVIILGYDSFDNEKGSTSSITEKEFKEHIKYLAEAGYKSISIDDLYNWIKNGYSLPPKSILLTFEGGYKSQYTKAFPILKQYHMTGALLIPTNTIGAKDRLSGSQIREMLGYGFSVASIGTTYTDMMKLDDDKVINELSDSKIGLEILTNKDVRFFAYPGGMFSKGLEGMVKDAGYSGAFTMIMGKNYRDTPPFELRRIFINKDMSDIESFKDAINLRGDVTDNHLKEMLNLYRIKKLKRAEEIVSQELTNVKGSLKNP